MITCERCNKTYKSDVLPLICTCGHVTRSVCEKENHWFPLHRYAVDHWDDWSESAAAEFLEEWERAIPNDGCNCQENWRTHDLEIRTRTAEQFFHDAHEAHNFVSETIGRRLYSLPEAYGIWRSCGRLEVDRSHLAYNRVDVVIPYCAADQRYLTLALESVLAQRYVKASIHIVRDSSHEFEGGSVEFDRTFPMGDHTIYIYRTSAQLGPYRIANELFRKNDLRSNFIALLDADDTATPDRLWRQLATMQRFGYHMTAAAMTTVVDHLQPKELVDRRGELLRSGDKSPIAPRGRCVNSTRTMTRKLFATMQGFHSELCSMDVEFDNRCLFAGVPVFFAADLVGKRRLHAQSMTASIPREVRRRCNDVVQQQLAKLEKQAQI